MQTSPLMTPAMSRRPMGERTAYEYGRHIVHFEQFLTHSPGVPFAEMAQAWLRTLSPSQQKVARAALRHRFGATACDWGALQVSRYRRDEARLLLSILTSAARDRLAETLRDDRERALIPCLYTLRRAEVAALRWAEIDLGPGEALVRRGKGGKSFWTLLTASAQLALAAWFDRAGSPADLSPVFPTPSGGHYAPAALGDVVRRCLIRAGLWSPGRGCAHRFRRTFATAYLRANPGDIEGLRLIFGHEDIATTVDYVFLQPEDLAPRVARVRL